MHVWPVPVAKAVLGADAHRVGMLCGQEQEKAEEVEVYDCEPVEFLNFTAMVEDWAEAQTHNEAQFSSAFDEQLLGIRKKAIEASAFWRRWWGDAQFGGWSMRGYVFWQARMLSCVGEREPRKLYTCVCWNTVVLWRGD